MILVIKSKTYGVFEVILDDDTPSYILNKKWHIRNNYNRGWYVCRNGKDKNGKKICVRLHRELLNAPNDLHVDHINGNTLDNRLCNLRLCTRSENKRNEKLRKDNSSGYKGVYYLSSARKKKYRAKIKNINLGYFLTAEEAAKAYNEAAVKYFGQFAKLNEIYEKEITQP